MEWLKQWIWWAISKLMSLPKEIAYQFFDALKAALPDIEMPSFYDSFGTYYEVVDGWVPITEVIGLWGIYVVFQTALIIYLWILKHIPTMG